MPKMVFIEHCAGHYAGIRWKDEIWSLVITVVNNDLHIPTHIAHTIERAIFPSPFGDVKCDIVFSDGAGRIPCNRSINRID
jgi:hypothetical protein